MLSYREEVSIRTENTARVAVTKGCLNTPRCLHGRAAVESDIEPRVPTRKDTCSKKHLEKLHGDKPQFCLNSGNPNDFQFLLFAGL